ncbi:ROK family protein [Amycolatopsis cihanbeyliensis]|uniref:Glucokinase n=1 Tax=Amycolatopsis cihanbeyliensis TaxID=1128664 RepID=A0A542CUU7_AMYCI|nr:ROK family protein [Amycolatopsis cihanbeyliensis]TQI94595.1 glucokinase [Amycolatopsis cihanbeyliensis]
MALDVGGTEIKAALLGAGAEVLAGERVPTRRGAHGTATGDSVADQVVELVRRLRAAADGAEVVAVGVVVPGIVDDVAGIARYSANLGWRDVPFGRLLGERIDLPVAFGHDVSASGIAEWRLGAARGFRDVAMVPVGTGIAAALLLDGRPYRAGGLAGELGHVDIGHGLPCACGASGCLEVTASASGVARRYAERTGIAVPGAAEVVRAARQGDEDAAAVLGDAVDGLGRGLRILTTLLAPEVIVLGGGLFGAREFILDPLRSWLAGRLTFQRLPELRVAELGAEAGCLGAGLLAWDAT